MKARFFVLIAAVLSGLFLLAVTLITVKADRAELLPMSGGQSSGARPEIQPPPPDLDSSVLNPSSTEIGSQAISYSRDVAYNPETSANFGTRSDLALASRPPKRWTDPPTREGEVPDSARRDSQVVTKMGSIPPTMQVYKPSEPGVDEDIRLYMNYAVIEGYLGANQSVHMLLDRAGILQGEARTRSDSIGYFWANLMHAGWYASLQAGDILTVEVGAAPPLTMIVPAISATVYPLTDTITGQIFAAEMPSEVQINSQGNTFSTTVDLAGNFSLNLSSAVDILWASWVQVGFQDSNGSWSLAFFFPQDGMVIHQDDPIVRGYTDPLNSVQVEAEHAGQSFSREVVANWRDGYWEAIFSEIGQLSASDQITTWINGIPNSAQVHALTAGFDLPAEQVIGTAPANSPVTVMFSAREGLSTQNHFQVAPADVSGVFTATFAPLDLDTRNPTYVVFHDPASKADHWISPHQPLALLDWPQNRVEGYALPASEITVTLKDAGMADLESHHTTTGSFDGWFQVDFAQTFESGFKLLFDGGIQSVVDLVDLSIDLDLENDQLNGVAPANQVVWAQSQVSFGTFYGNYLSVDGLGNFLDELGGIQDLRNDAWAEVYYPQGGFVDQPGWQFNGMYSPMIGLNVRQDGLWGAVPGANVPVTFTLEHAGSVYETIRQSDSVGSFGWVQFSENGIIDILAGDTLTVEIEGWKQSVIAPALTVDIDTQTDVVSGVGPANSFVRVMVNREGTALHLPTDNLGNYLADFTELVDLRNGDEVEVGLFDENWNYLHTLGQAPFARVNSTWDSVDGWFGPNASVEFTLTDAEGNPKGSGSGTSRPDGWLDGIVCDEGCNILPTDLVTVTSDQGFSARLELITITGRIDVDVLNVSGDMDGAVFPGNGGEFWLWSDARSEGTGVSFELGMDGGYHIDLSDFGIMMGDQAEVWFIDPEGNWVGIELFTLWLRVNYAHDWVELRTNPGATTIITVEGKAEIQGFAGLDGWYQTYQHQEDWDAEQPNLEPGDVVNAEADGYFDSVNPIGTIDGIVDSNRDVVSGTLNAPFVENLTVRCEVWVENGPPGIEIQDVAPAGGEFLCDFSSVGWDVLPGHDIALIYIEPDGSQVVNIVSVPYARANMTWDAIDGWFGTGANVSFTAADALGNPKGTGSGTARPDGWLEGIGCVSGCDLVPGDLVTITSDQGFFSVLELITITGRIEVGESKIYGSMSGAPSFDDGGEFWLQSDARGEGTGDHFAINPDGNYEIDLSGFGIVMGDKAELWYFAPDGNRIGVEFFTLLLRVNYAHDWVELRTNPGATASITVEGKADILGIAEPDGWYYTHRHTEDWDPGQPDFEPGDAVFAEADGYHASVDSIGTIDGIIDNARDVISGTLNAPFAEDLTVGCEIWVENGPPGIEIKEVASDGGEFICDFGSLGWDILPGQDIALFYIEPEGSQVINMLAIPYARANITWNTVDGRFGANATVFYTVTDYLGVYKGSGEGTAQSDGWLNTVGCECDMVPGDLVTVTSSSGFEALLIPISITVDIDEDSDIVVGDMENGSFPANGYAEDWNHGRQQGGNTTFITDENGGYSADFSSSYDLWTGDYVNIWYIDPQGNHLGREAVALRIEAFYSDDNVYVETSSSVPVFVNVNDAYYYFGQTSESGQMWTWDNSSLWLPNQPDIQPGDAITVAISGHNAWIHTVGSITGAMDLEENTIGGTIDAPDFSGETLQVNCSVWMPGGPGINTTANATDGSYLCDLDNAGWDLQLMDNVGVYYYEPDGDAVVRAFQALNQIFLPVVRR